MNPHCARLSSQTGSASPTRHTPDASSGTYSTPCLPVSPMGSRPSGAGRTVALPGWTSSRIETGRGFVLRPLFPTCGGNRSQDGMRGKTNGLPRP
jgi:hypothetical protein